MKWSSQEDETGKGWTIALHDERGEALYCNIRKLTVAVQGDKAQFIADTCRDLQREAHLHYGLDVPLPERPPNTESNG